MQYSLKYDQLTVGQDRISVWVAQLQSQHQLIVQQLAGLTISELEWQPCAGVNTIGMLLAHIAVTEVYWMSAATIPSHTPERLAERVRAILGIDLNDDGMPIGNSGNHSLALRDTMISEYLSMIESARIETLSIVRRWNDGLLRQSFWHDDTQVTYDWVLFHIVEHASSHIGQALYTKRLRKQLMGHGSKLIRDAS